MMMRMNTALAMRTLPIQEKHARIGLSPRVEDLASTRAIINHKTKKQETREQEALKESAHSRHSETRMAH